ncbi:unnamed protein product [Cuscuta epithymum]|uniref:Calmodulin-binding domain-containing protein n=1 Tax=Cuscuta epithymum TaxID=186058 RepID=A0AAV0C8J5_9ASTE|nr:unnamed protein product [Cuscuta epithymum]
MPDSSPHSNHFMKTTACFDAKKERSLGGDDRLSMSSSTSDHKIKSLKGVKDMTQNFRGTISFRRKGRTRMKKKPTLVSEEKSNSSLPINTEGNLQGIISQPSSAGKSEPKNRARLVDYESKSSTKEKHFNMWNLFQQHMISDPADETANQLAAPVSSESCSTEMENADLNGENEIEVKKLIAIKLVREAIEKILLPEVSELSSDNQSIASDQSTLDQETSEYSKDDDSESSLITDSKGFQEKVKTIREVSIKPEKKAPKHWDNLKKWILLQRFVKELEKVKRINRPRNTRQLEDDVEHDPEAEKIRYLRPQNVDERKRTEEWMLDYALQQAVSQLAPTQKRKVELLVRAFETVVPPQGGCSNSIQTTLPKLKSNSEEEQITTKGNECSPKADEVTIYHDKKVATEITLEEETKHQQPEKQKHISMWHMISQHVLPGVITKVGTQLLDETDDEVEVVITVRGRKAHQDFSRDDAIELVKEVVHEILITKVQDDSSDTQLVTSDMVPGKELPVINLPQNNSNQVRDGDTGDSIVVKEEGKKQVTLSKSKNWSKLKRLMLLKRSITALQSARKPEKVELRNQMIDERRKAEQWMLDYAVQNIVTKLTPARKRRVAMLVEAFEAVVPFPQV